MSDKGSHKGVNRKDRLIHERVHDPYKARRKPAAPRWCPECSVLFRNGRWEEVEERPPQAHEELCPACCRVRDSLPAGVINLKGAFSDATYEEIVRLVRNQEKLEKAEHPLHRVMNINRHGEGIEITTTDIHLPHRIGQALIHAFKGDLECKYEKETYFIRINWEQAG